MSMENVNISVVITAYNVGEDLERCLKSLLNQPYDDYEIVLVNNGSTDSRTIEICNEYKGTPKIRFFNKEYGECIDGRRKGLQEAKGQYIVFCDADDYVSADYMKIIHDAVKHEADYYILTNYLNKLETNDFYEEKGIFESGYVFLEELYCHLLNFEINPIWNKIYLRKLFEPPFEILPDSITSTDDIYINLRYMKKVSNAYFYNKGGYYHYCDSVSSATSSNIKINRLKEIEILYNTGIEFADGFMLSSTKQKFNDKIYGLYIRIITYLLKNGTIKSEISEYVRNFNIEKNVKILKFTSFKGLVYRTILKYRFYDMAKIMCK